MNNLKKILFLLIVLTLTFCMFSCDSGDGNDPCTSHVDENKDGKCDSCGKKVEADKPEKTELKLIEGGEAKFQIIYAASPSKVINAITRVKNSLAALDIEVGALAERTDNVKDCEILIGDITTRDDKYKTDGHDYGKEGYVIKIVDSKVIINAGSDDALIDAINKFAEDILGIDDDTEVLTDIVMTSEQVVEEIQNNYRITSLSVGGNNMKGYTIAVNKANKYHMAAAQLLQSNLYERTGLWLDIVEETKADKSIVIKSVAKNAVDGGFKVSVSGSKLLIECGYDNKIEDATDEFISEKIVAQRGDVNFTGTVFTDDISVVYYKDFGAKGDGISDDFFALKAAHDFANISGQTVKADSGKTYRIYNTAKNNSIHTIVIKTNVEWGNAKFIIEDTNIGYYDGTGMASKHIFHIQSDYEDYRINDSETLNKLAGIGNGTKKLDITLDYPAMLTIYNADSKVYRRKGYSSEDGTDQHEVILIDKDGNIDESTPFMFDYIKVTSVVVHRTDVEPIKVSGGTITTMASRVNIIQFDENNEKAIKTGYFLRGINVSRPGTVVEGVKHYVEGEISVNEQKQGILGPAYYGFFYGSNTNDVLFKDCVLTGRRCYNKSISGLATGTQGTYDFGAICVNKIRLEGCIQSNFYLTINDDGTTSPAFDLTYENGVPIVTKNNNSAVFSMSDNPAGGRICWGIGGTNFCKNMEYINSVLSRFDAHQGLLNGKAVGTTINFFAMVGKGDFLIENCTWIAPDDGKANNSMIYLRDDYGSPWEGTITVKDTLIVNHKDDSKVSDFGLVFHAYQNWYYGYTCYFPNLIFDNITVTNMADGDKINLLFPGCTVINADIHLESFNTKNQNPVVPPEFITVKNNTHNYKIYVPNNNFFSETDFSASDEGSIVRTK